MTIDEAISIMNVIVHMLEPQYDTDRVENAVEMAIKALENQPTDAVDRVTIKEYLESFGKVKTELKPVTPQPKMGHWITTRTFMHDGEYYCDRCKCDAPNNEKWDYCPNCGAKMQEVEE